LVSIDFKNYLTLLTTSILEIFEKENLIEININIENIQFNTSTTIPLGLIVNEIVSNALKHAFPNNKSGIINISIKHKNENYFELIIEDNGIGFSSDHLDKKSFGLELINLLSYQMHGKLSIDSSPNNSTKYTIDFKEIYD
jgi:two-component sensor histidine kinase